MSALREPRVAARMEEDLMVAKRGTEDRQAVGDTFVAQQTRHNKHFGGTKQHKFSTGLVGTRMLFNNRVGDSYHATSFT